MRRGLGTPPPGHDSDVPAPRRRELWRTIGIALVAAALGVPFGLFSRSLRVESAAEVPNEIVTRPFPDVGEIEWVEQPLPDEIEIDYDAVQNPPTYFLDESLAPFYEVLLEYEAPRGSYEVRLEFFETLDSAERNFKWLEGLWEPRPDEREAGGGLIDSGGIPFSVDLVRRWRTVMVHATADIPLRDATDPVVEQAEEDLIRIVDALEVHFEDVTSDP